MRDPIYIANFDEFIACYEEGASIKELADALGFARSVVARRMLEQGVQLRNRAAANCLLMSHRTPEEKRRNTEAAHAAWRGQTFPLAYKLRRAKQNEKHLFNQSVYERVLCGALQKAKLRARPQAAIGIYNVDLLVQNRLAVEVFGGGWHASKNHIARNQYLMGQGYSRLDIWVDKNHLLDTEACLERIKQLLTLSEKTHQYIWCDGKDRHFRSRLCPESSVNRSPL